MLVIHEQTLVITITFTQRGTQIEKRIVGPWWLAAVAHRAHE